ncbi:hypothetical protein ACCO45_006535 [Purpureocillium lilacinum]|uniref:Uncharacterized protein n=1 Tax=Purpureocillium lilacinum TaxID=33203 RepID=A0ACC4DSV7_PURLI
MSWRAAVTTATHDCSPRADDLFGPVVGRQCRGGFDLTLLFEQAVLSIIPAAIIVVAFPLRFAYLATARPKTLLRPARFWKLLAACVFLLLQLALLVLWSHDEVNRTRASLPLAVLNVIVAIQLVVLSWMEDGRSIRPSSMLSSYLAITVVLDIAQARTLWLRRLNTPIAAVFTATVAVKAVMLLLESRKKTRYLKQAHADLPPRRPAASSTAASSGGSTTCFAAASIPTLPSTICTPGRRACFRSAEHQNSTGLVAASQARAPLRVSPGGLEGHALAHLPFLISRVLSLLSEPDSQPARNVGYSLILAAAFIYMGLTLSTLYYNHSVYRFMTMFRGASVALIFNHMLTLPLGEYDDSAVVTLMSTDVDRIVLCLISLNEIWARVIEVAVGIVLLARQLGWVCLVPLFVVVVSFFGSAEISRTIGARQRVWIDAVQQRITITASMLAEMRSVKMMGLSPVLSAIVQDQRVQETRRMAAARWSIVWQNVVQNLPWAVAPSLTFIIYVAQATARGKSSIDVTQAFTALSIITLLTDPASKLLSAIPSTAASLGCFDRIQEFLVARPRTDPRFAASPSRTAQGQDAAAISMQNMSLRPVATAEPILSDVSFAIPRGSLAMVIGPVGSGKTTLLKGLLGEVKDQNGGSVTVASKQIALCVQVPWLPNTTIREAISGYVEEGQNVDQAWYQRCLHACALDYDLDRLADGEETRVGSASTVLSGGQRARIALARAVYARTDIMLLDDVLGALDTNTQATIMSRLFGDEGLLKKRNVTVVLATHATEFLKYADKVLIVSDGKVRDGGKGENAIPKELVDALKATSSPSVSEEVEHKEPDAKDKADEISKANRLSDMSRSAGDLDVYRYYFKSVGWPKTALFVGFVIVDVFCSSFSTIWLKWWAEVDGGQIALYMSVYVALAFLTSVGTGGYVWSILILISPYTARKLHAVLLRVVMRAPQSFFSATDSGSILNRFSQDMTIIEGQLPIGILVAVSNLFSSLAAAALVTTGSVYMVVSVPFLVFTIWALQHVYLRTSRQLRLLDLESKSPLYSHFLETVGGLSTIRAFGWQSRFKAKNERLLDDSQRPHYLLYCSQRWLNLVLDLIVGAQAVLVIGLAVGLRRSTSPGLLGVSLNSILSFSGALSSLVSGWTMLETSLGSIARLMSFEATVKPEDRSGETYQPPPSWPERGAIEFRQVTAVHSPGAVGIREISLQIKPGQKVGICGRTGSGKSSLVATLVRLLEMDSGSIFIDGVDIATVPRETIRERLVSLPQDPLVLNGSVRLNVDPEERSTEEAVATALHRVGLGDLAQSRGIMADITATSLSRGQQQLLALARAVVKKQACGSTHPVARRGDKQRRRRDGRSAAARSA